ncbi:MAG: GntR family transcriptional regulator [Gemmatimonadales bacterium]|nr:GntR family transcriptional regulator [Gemmatimonadales bacterium]NIN49008.1 GntR family transcriptional regulator [Gemmatimonadales bacterium]NIP06472.1 GntR family transcriptional regulator [Gemmatimonadales bacterium]NIS63687.1 GntR family transcriptional regulator [Gemmatimonadales bacterium]
MKSQVYGWILQGDATPGRPLRLSDAAARLGVSVTPIREALIELEAEGLVQTEMGRGFVVRPLRVEEVQELYPLIIMLEIRALRSMPQPSEARLDQLDSLNAELVREGHDPLQAVILDNRWHGLLLQDAPAEITREILGMLKRRVFRYEFKYMASTGARPSTAQHGVVVEALREGDRAAAAAALEENWRAGPELLIPWLEEA